VQLVNALSKQRKIKKKTKKVQPKLFFKELLIITFNLGEYSLIKSILDKARIKYFFVSRHFQMVQPWSDLTRLMVREDQINKAWKLLRHLNFRFSEFPSDDLEE
jgi:hypothetical protein